MAETSPQPDSGSDDDKKRIRRMINQRGLTGLRTMSNEVA